MEQSLLSLDDLRLVAALAEAGSLAQAARRLGINHASAWRRLGALETRLGVRLFERARTGYAATPAGEEAIAAGTATLRTLDELGRRLAGRDLRPTGTVRVTTTETLVDLLAEALATLRASYPGILVEVAASDSLFTLTRRDADIALRPADAAPDALVARKLSEIAVAIYAAADKAAPGDDLAGCDWVAPDESLSHIAAFRWMAAHVPVERVRLRASSLTAVAAAVRAGIGVAPIPCFLADRDSRLVRVAPPVAEMASSLWLITHPDLRRTARVRGVLDHLAAVLGQQKLLLAGRAPRR